MATHEEITQGEDIEECEVCEGREYIEVSGRKREHAGTPPKEKKNEEKNRNKNITQTHDLQTKLDKTHEKIVVEPFGKDLNTQTMQDKQKCTKSLLSLKFLREFVQQTQHRRKQTRYIVNYKKNKQVEKEILKLKDIIEIKRRPKGSAAVSCVLLRIKMSKNGFG